MHRRFFLGYRCPYGYNPIKLAPLTSRETHGCSWCTEKYVLTQIECVPWAGWVCFAMPVKLKDSLQCTGKPSTGLCHSAPKSLGWCSVSSQAPLGLLKILHLYWNLTSIRQLHATAVFHMGERCSSIYHMCSWISPHFQDHISSSQLVTLNTVGLIKVSLKSGSETWGGTCVMPGLFPHKTKTPKWRSLHQCPYIFFAQ